MIDKLDHHPADGPEFFRVRLYGYSQDQNTWEPIWKIPRNHVVSYLRRRRIPVPLNIAAAHWG